MQEIYKKLREKLDKFPIGLPESEEAYEILETLFSPQEAELALELPMQNKSLDELAAELDEDPDTLQAKLDGMVDKGTLYRVKHGDTLFYRILPSVEGFAETPFWSGRPDEKTRKLAPLWGKYFEKAFAYELGDRKQSVMRVIPLDTTISNVSEITPYEDLVELLGQNTYFAVAHCPCRQFARATGEGCDHSLEVCFHFNSMGRYMVENGMGRELTREETLDILKKCNEEGLVHFTYNHQGKVNTICNCCGCCCVFFRALKEFDQERALARSNYVSTVDSELCSACETCAERCPVDAIEVDDVAVVDADMCVGCGVCVPTCPAEAIILVRRPAGEIVEIVDSRTYLINALEEKGVI